MASARRSRQGDPRAAQGGRRGRRRHGRARRARRSAGRRRRAVRRSAAPPRARAAAEAAARARALRARPARVASRIRRRSQASGSRARELAEPIRRRSASSSGSTSSSRKAMPRSPSTMRCARTGSTSRHCSSILGAPSSTRRSPRRTARSATSKPRSTSYDRALALGAGLDVAARRGRCRDRRRRCDPRSRNGATTCSARIRRTCARSSRAARRWSRRNPKPRGRCSSSLQHATTSTRTCCSHDSTLPSDPAQAAKCALAALRTAPHHARAREILAARARGAATRAGVRRIADARRVPREGRREQARPRSLRRRDGARRREPRSTAARHGDGRVLERQVVVRQRVHRRRRRADRNHADDRDDQRRALRPRARWAHHQSRRRDARARLGCADVAPARADARGSAGRSIASRSWCRCRSSRRSTSSTRRASTRSSPSTKRPREHSSRAPTPSSGCSRPRKAARRARRRRCSRSATRASACSACSTRPTSSATTEIDEVVDFIGGTLGELVEAIVPFSARHALDHKRDEQGDDGNWPALAGALEERFFQQARQLKRDACARTLRGSRRRSAERCSRERQRAVDAADAARGARDELTASALQFSHDGVLGERKELSEQMAALYRRAAREVLDLVRPRRLPFSSHSATAADRDYLIALLASGFESAIETRPPSRRRRADRCAAAKQRPPREARENALGFDVVGDLERVAADRIGLAMSRVFDRARAYLRGYLEGGYVEASSATTCRDSSLPRTRSITRCIGRLPISIARSAILSPTPPPMRFRRSLAGSITGAPSSMFGCLTWRLAWFGRSTSSRLVYSVAGLV